MMATWSRDEFVGRLRAVGAARYHDRHPFQRRMNDGGLSSEQLRGWIVNRFHYQQSIPIKDAIILSRLPTREDRRRWLTRIVDHDGRQGEEGGIAAWLRLGDAAGIPRERMLNPGSIEPGVRAAVDRYVAFCRDRPWPEAVASSLTELFAPALVGSRMAAIRRHYPWVQPEGLEYFRRRLDQAPRDVEHGLQLVLEQTRNLEDQERAVAALAFKCDVLWALLDAVEAGYPSPAAGAAAWRPAAHWRPRLARRALLRHDDVRGVHLVLLPERVLRLSPTATAVVRLCDGGHTVEEIVAELETRYDGAGVKADVTVLLGDLSERGVFE